MNLAYVDNVQPDELKVSNVYFMVTFFDKDLLIPNVGTVVYLGKDLFKEQDEMHYFQDYEQHVDEKTGLTSVNKERQLICSNNALHNFYRVAEVAKIFAQCAVRSVGKSV